jgi:hypothetical protein
MCVCGAERCFEALCGLQTSYRIASSAVTEFFLEEGLDSAQTCLFGGDSIESESPFALCGLSGNLEGSNRHAVAGIPGEVWRLGPHLPDNSARASMNDIGKGDSSDKGAYTGRDGDRDGEGFQGQSQRFSVRWLPDRPPREGWINITLPMTGTIRQNRSVRMEFKKNHEASLAEYFLLEVMYIDRPKRIPIDQDLVTAVGPLEPATWFINVVPIFADGSSGYPTSAYLELVLSREEIAKERHFVAPHRRLDYSPAGLLPAGTAGTAGTADTFISRETLPLTDKDQQIEPETGLEGSGRGENTAALPPPSPLIHVCVFASADMDGQKTIFLNQMRYLGTNSTRYKFSWLLSGTDSNLGGNAGVVVQRLAELPFVGV